MMKLLKEHKLDQNTQRLAMGDSWIDEGAVFTQWNGRNECGFTIQQIP
jgi:hypothetical protein